MTEDIVLAAASKPLSMMGRAALNSFLTLPGVEEWRPDQLLLAELSLVFDIGLPFALLAGNRSAEPHRRAIGSVIAHGNPRGTSEWSEVQAAAMLSNWGANVTFLARQAVPTPDIVATWREEVDVEVTRGEVRALHEAVKRSVQQLSQVVTPGDIEWNIMCFLADASNPNELNAVLDVAISLRPGEVADSPGRWYARAIALELADEVVGARGTELFGPDWWPANQPSYFSSGRLIGSLSSPAVVIRSLVPHTSYINPVLRKANSGQRREGKAYLIAVDTTHLPRAHEKLIDDLDAYFPVWNHVSAVMLFEAWFYTGFERKEWLVSIHPNPSAIHMLPRELMAIADRTRHRIAFDLVAASMP